MTFLAPWGASPDMVNTMRWQNLFSDLEAQWRQQEQRELAAEISDRTRRERAEVHWSDRLAAALEQQVRVYTVTGPVVGVVEDVGRDWLLLEELGRRSALIPQSAVLSLAGVGPATQTHPGLGRRFGLGVALRAISRDRARVVATDLAGAEVAGTIDVVGADYLEVTEHPTDVPRRPEFITGTRLISFAGLAVLRRAS